MPDPKRWGIDPSYQDASGHWHDIAPGTAEALLEAMGAEGDEPAPGPALFTGPDGTAVRLGGGRLELEASGEARVEAALPPELPFGYHRFVPDDGGPARPVIVTPGRCRVPGSRAWGWAAQLYATRSTASWGIGDLADLRELGAWSADLGARAVMVNPLHAALPGDAQQASPYSPSTRSFRNPLYIRVEEVPGAGDLPGLPELAAAGRALNDDRRIDRDAVWRLKSDALEALFARFEAGASAVRAEFARYRAEQADPLDGYATFCALAERHGLPWQAWPQDVRRPDGGGVAAFVADPAGARRVAYHAWLQWLLDRQLAAASERLDVVHDLAIGVDAHGADTWRWQDVFALGARIGAPPDEFNRLGQDWGMPPFDPWRLRGAGYQPFVQTVRAGLRHAGGLRFDHVMGLFRLWWIPEGAGAAEGAYVRYPFSDLLDILALECHRAGAYVLGEDLGTVEPETREELARRGVLSYRLLWFEPDPPGDGAWPVQALGAVTTHDLPTVAGLWTGSDLAAQRVAGMSPNEEGTLAMRERVATWIGAGDDAAVAEVIVRVYRLLGRAPSLLLLATLDDALAVEERPNMPGTVDAWPNWSIALPRPLEELERSPLALAIAAALSEQAGGRATST